MYFLVPLSLTVTTSAIDCLRRFISFYLPSIHTCPDSSRTSALYKSCTYLLSNNCNLTYCMQGIFVSRVVNGGPCHEAGIHVGDKLLSVSSLLVGYFYKD